MFTFKPFYNDDYSKICATMACASATTSGSYSYSVAWEGTTCGNGKVKIKIV
jgi:hypothetical protein